MITGGAGADVINSSAGIDTYLLGVRDSTITGFDIVTVTTGDIISGGGLNSGNAVVAATGAQLLTDLVTNNDLATALKETIGAPLAHHTFLVHIADSQVTAGTNYTGDYLVSEFAGSATAVDTDDIVVKLIGVNIGISNIAFSGHDIAVTV